MSREIRPVTGFAVEPWLDELAELRIEVFRDFPYLYEGNREYERRYLDRYAQSDRSVFVLALEFNRLVGAATALPLLEADEEFQAPFRNWARSWARCSISASRCSSPTGVKESVTGSLICENNMRRISDSCIPRSARYNGRRITPFARTITGRWMISGGAGTISPRTSW